MIGIHKISYHEMDERDPVAGVWQRVSLEVPTGRVVDVATSVWWLQTRCSKKGNIPRLFADIRIPPRVAAEDGRDESAAVSVPLADILRQRASAGVFECAPVTSALNSKGGGEVVTPPSPLIQCTWHCNVCAHLFLRVNSSPPTS